MDLRSLKHVTALGRLLNFTNAAETLGISQSALTRSIQAVERQLGVQLFDRDRGKVALTPLGQEFHEQAVHLLREADKMEKTFKAASVGYLGEVKFGMAPLPAAICLEEMLLKWLKGDSKVRLCAEIGDYSQLMHLLLNRSIEFFFCVEREPVDARLIDVERVSNPDFSFYVRAGHPILKQRGVSQKYPLISSTAIFPDSPYVATLKGHIELEFPSIVVNDYNVLRSMTLQSNAVWASSPLALRAELASGTIAKISHSDGIEGASAYLSGFRLRRATLSRASREVYNTIAYALKADA